MSPRKHAKIIDLLVSVVDNYGDMGFAIELIELWRSRFGDTVDFVIWTDDVEKMRKFATEVSDTNMSIFPRDQFGLNRPSEIAISLLHAPIPEARFFAKVSLVLRVDYVSFDPQWVMNHGKEHLLSTRDRQIIEVIQSPLSGSAGLLPLNQNNPSKHQIAQELHRLSQKYIDDQKKWITIFAYPDTITQMDWLSFPTDVEVLVFSDQTLPLEYITHLPLLPVEVFHSLLLLSEWSIIRGDMTGSMMLQSGRPYYWDIYRGLGGIHTDLSDAFLQFLGADESYRDIHHRINHSKNHQISYADCVRGLESMVFCSPDIPDLLTTLKKYVDRFYFSL